MLHHNLPTVIVIAGPTAVGKTDVAIALAKHFNCEIISADSRQCFKELNIGVAKPSHLQLQTIPHHFISSHSIHENMSAGLFEQFALKTVHHLFTKNKIAIIVGGTGLYINAFCNGMDAIPAIDEAIRNNIVNQYNEQGLEWLQQQVQNTDEQYWNSCAEKQNPQRLMRALEVKLGTGISITEFQKTGSKKRPFNIIKIGIELPRETLYNQINTRVNIMMEQGLLEEVKSLIPCKQINALQTVGYTELFSYLQSEVSLDKAIELIKQHTRHYAKRQLTWFKKDTVMQWFLPAQINNIINYCTSKF